jgi:sulfur-oxidizing protein SoxY
MLMLTGGAAGWRCFPRPARWPPDAVADEIEAFTGGNPSRARQGRLIIAERVENGSAVPLAVEVDSAMEGDDMVESVIVLAERNPNPIIATFHFSALSGAASFRRASASPPPRRSSPLPGWPMEATGWTSARSMSPSAAA